MRASFQEYLARSLEIRRLSMPSTDIASDEARFYECFRDNFLQIKSLLQQSRRTLDREVYTPLKDPLSLDAETAAELMEFSDSLADTRTLEVVDSRLALMIVSDLEPYYRVKSERTKTLEDRARYIHCLYRRLALGYNVAVSFERGRSARALSELYRTEVLECAEATRTFIEDLTVFGSLPPATQQELVTMLLFRATGYERDYYDEKLVRLQVESYRECLEIFSRPEIQACAPEIDWEFQIASVNSYLSLVHEFFYWEQPPAELLDEMSAAAEQAVRYVEKHPDNYRIGMDLIDSTRFAIGFYRGEVSFAQMVQKYVDWNRTGDPNGYDRENMDNNLLSIILALWLFGKYPEKVAEYRDFLIEAQKSVFTYIRDAHDQGTYETMQRYTSYIVESYIELPGGISFREFYENILRASQPTLYVHCKMVGLISIAILDAALQHDPEMLIGVQGFHSVEELLTQRDELEKFLFGCCMYHDAGKLNILDTINLFSRALFPREFQLVKQHTEIGYELLQKRESTRRYAGAALYHHLWYDEKGGYPQDESFRGEKNAMLYHIITCADCMDAATDSVGRAYSAGKSFDMMLEDLRTNSGRMFSPDVVALFDHEDLQERVRRLIEVERITVYQTTFRYAQRK